ncbi:AraC family transcriptional regulator [Auraticoccus monumenti]|uniref:AraC-type DNA-binding protein n=1 Tax=Auraticoccus monumenti TaxID=675864 RepID=A0A1G7A0R1_9ACTN|nr:AraC family transcriptional regulator [Auraticoccus monumenti]SDE08213.1 AraC-type DNA-binding protein [Auraticoccus monumenti]
MPRSGGASQVRAWRPEVPGVTEVLHAHLVGHAYPAHTHDTWTLLLVDDGAVVYDLDRHRHDTSRARVTVLPPGVPHDGRPATGHGFRKRVVYLDAAVLGEGRTGRAVDHPGWADPVLHSGLDHLHRVLTRPEEAFEAEGRLALVVERLRGHLPGSGDERVPAPGAPTRRLARELRELLDASVVPGITLARAGHLLDAPESTLVRAFSAEYGIPPHRYLTGRRLDRARRLLLAGERAAEVAVAVGFHDQAHLSRHFRRLMGVPPGQFARVARTAQPAA